ncbi:MAG: hypothetical protein HFI70_07560 [Lachnospiraceae bacterium]|nr:hypothetical protein [Lachnospiraceae bacterium]
MNSFKIGNTEFGIGNVQFFIADNLLNLEISGNDDIFDELTIDDNCEWSWALYPPQIYFRDVLYTGKDIEVDTDFLEEYDVALYMMEHNDFIGTLKLSDSSIDICGQVEIDGELLSLVISIERKNL